MSQSGSAPLARDEPSNALPSPSPSLTNLPDDVEPPQNTPKAIVAALREILSVARAGNKKLTVAGYAKAFASLDSLDLFLASGNQLDASLKAFKLELLADLVSLTPKAPTSYASATSSPSSAPAPPPPRAAPPPPKPPAVKSSEFIISMDKADDILALPLPEIKGKVEAAIAAAGHEKLKGITLRGVRVLARGRLLVAIDSEKAASLLKQSAPHWVPKLAKKGSLVIPRCQIVVNGVPTSFNPSSPTAAHDLYAHNRSAIADPSVISEIRWLNPKVLRDPKKKASSLLITLSDIPSADLSICMGLAVESSICTSHRYEEPPLACYNCQHHGHTQHQCGQKTPTCARCAGSHRSSSCPCATSSTKCAPGKRCDHFTPRCANCKGKHPAYHKDCPVRIKEHDLQRQRLSGRIFFDPAFNPYASVRDESSSPFFFLDAPSSSAPSPSK